MLRFKKSSRIFALAMVFVFMFSTLAMAAMPNNTIIFGTKAYDVSLLNDATQANQILADFVANGNSFVYKDLAGNLKDANGTTVPAATLPAVTYKAANGTTTQYAAGDTDAAALSVTSASAINLTTIKVVFSGVVDAVTTANFTVSKGTLTGVQLATDSKSAQLSVTGLNYSDAINVTVTGVKRGTTTIADTTKAVTVPAVSDLYKLVITCDATNNAIVSNGASKTMLTVKLQDKATSTNQVVDGIVSFSATKGGLAQSDVAMQAGVATVQLTSAASDTAIVSYINAILSDVPTNAVYEGLSGNFQVTFAPDATPAGTTTFVSAVSAESNQCDRFSVTFSDKITAAQYKAALTAGQRVVATGLGSYGWTIDGSAPVIKDVVNASDKVLTFILDTDSATSVAPVTAQIENVTPWVAGAKNYFRDNANHNLVLATVGTKVLANAGINFILTDAAKPNVYGVTAADQQNLTIRFSEAMAEDTLEGAVNVINGKFLIDGRDVILDAAATSYSAAQAAVITANNQIMVDTLSVGSFNNTTQVDTRSIISIVVDPAFKLSAGAHTLQIANVSDWAGLTDPANRLSTQTFDFSVTADLSKPTASLAVQSPEQWLLTFDKDVTSVAGKTCADAIKIYFKDSTTAGTELVNGVDYRVSQIDAAGMPVAVVAAGAAVPSTKLLLIETLTDWTVKYGTAATTINYFTSTKNPYVVVVSNVQSANGNAIDATTLYAATPYDGTSPSISSATDLYDLRAAGATTITKNTITATASGAHVYVTMSEPVQLRDAATTGGLCTIPLTQSEQQAAGAGIPVPTFEFVKGDVTVPGTISNGSIAEDDKTFVIDPATPLSAGTWTLYIRSISDDVGNTSATINTTVTVVAPEAQTTDTRIAWAAFDNAIAAPVVGTDYDYVYVKFTKVMQATDAIGVSRTTNYVFNGLQLPAGSQIFKGIAGVTNDWDGVTIRMPFDAWNGTAANTNYACVLNVANNFKSAGGEALTGPYEVQLADTANVSAADSDMLFEARYANVNAPVVFGGSIVTAASATDVNANGKIDSVSLTLDQATTVATTAVTTLAINGKNFTIPITAAGAAGPIVATATAVNEVAGTSTSGLVIGSAAGAVIVNANRVVDLAAPIIAKADATVGTTTLTLTFSEPVWGGTAAVPAAIVAADFAYVDTNTAGATAIAGVAANATYVTTLNITLDAAAVATDITPDAGDDTINAVAANIFDAAGNAAPATVVGLE